MGAEAGEAALVLGMQQGDVHHRVAAAERGIPYQDAVAGGAQESPAIPAAMRG